MARCGCSGSSCSCQVVAGPGVKVTGVGSALQPYVISAGPEWGSIADQQAVTLGWDHATPIGSNATYSIMPPQPAGQMWVNLPWGDQGNPWPPIGTRLDVFIIGAVSPTDLYFVGNPGGGVPNLHWYGVQPTTEFRGWYSMVLVQGPGGGTDYPFWAIRWTPET